jgi:hypothetical protein
MIKKKVLAIGNFFSQPQRAFFLRFDSIFFVLVRNIRLSITFPFLEQALSCTFILRKLIDWFSVVTFPFASVNSNFLKSIQSSRSRHFILYWKKLSQTHSDRRNDGKCHPLKSLRKSNFETGG